MKAVLLAAGLGSRLKPLTNTIPKCLVPILNKPLLDYWLELTLESKHISDVYINLHYLKNKVTEHIATHWRHEKRITLYSEEQLKGTAGTLNGLNKELTGSPLLVIHADNLSKFNLDSFIHAHQTRPDNCVMTMMLFKTDAPSTCGIVERDEMARVITMHEKVPNPPGNLANGAVYIFEPEVLDWIVGNEAADISAEVIPAFHGKIYSWLNNVYHRDIGNPQSYALAQQEFTKR
ncbi:nucleotidyltransferase family protein [Paraglaciecola sp. MB-3u-78]|uniref:nucleotidyltransferase family protein n=1 Tax=Paraglaciecola sp. MB-3u-78 TaxID=2058332 RepID=UPI000C34DD27|nr:nucleotidyltransferase family protein [Paraglaciecola sp. MB-3u-78]PKH00814.1 mannose-1-phosphate guanylyltransferase [Paraglaciecola sp. MB-3u-78]